MISKVYLDTNVFIEAFEKGSVPASPVWLVLEAVERKELYAVTSDLSYAELLPKLIAGRQTHLLEVYRRLFDDGDLLEVVPVTREVLIKAAQLRSTQLSLKLPDAIHLASACLTGCSAVLSFDERLAKVGSVPVVPIEIDCLVTLRTMSS